MSPYRNYTLWTRIVIWLTWLPCAVGVLMFFLLPELKAAGAYLAGAAFFARVALVVLNHRPNQGDDNAS